MILLEFARTYLVGIKSESVLTGLWGVWWHDGRRGINQVTYLKSRK